jgi:hypothetical protein
LKPLWLEAVDIDSDPPHEADAVCSDGEPRWALAGLLDLLWIDRHSSDHAAANPDEAPDFTWWELQYFRCPAGQPARPTDFVWPHPPREYCHDPRTVLKSLVWLREALITPAVLKQRQLWAWFGFAEPYDEKNFARPFRDVVNTWIAFCERAVRRGHKLALRMDV